MPELLPEALANITAENPDILVITGDLLDVPLNWIEADVQKRLAPEQHKAVLQDYRLCYELLEDTDLPYLVLAGNHDLPSAMWEVFEQRDTFTYDGFVFHLFHDHETENNMPQRLDDQLARFLDALICNDPTPQIHLQHYVITPSLHEGYPLSYKMDRTMTQQIDNSGKVVLSLSGHHHDGSELIHLHHTYFTTGPAFCVAPFAYRFYDLIDNHITLTQSQLQ